MRIDLEPFYFYIGKDGFLFSFFNDAIDLDIGLILWKEDMNPYCKRCKGRKRNQCPIAFVSKEGKPICFNSHNVHGGIKE